MLDFENWCEKNEDRLWGEYEAIITEDGPYLEFYEYIAEQYEIAVSDYEDYEYEKFKDEKYGE